MARPTSRITALLIVAVGSLGCVLWPEGSGPGTAALTLAEALELRSFELAPAPVSLLVPRFAAPFRFFFRQGFYQTKP